MKHISEPEMHAVMATAIHPSHKFWAGQAMNNKVSKQDISVFSLHHFSINSHKNKLFKLYNI